MTMETLVWVGVGLLVAVLIGERAVVWRARQVKKRAELRDAFFDSATKALNYDDLPEEALISLELATQMLDNRRAAYLVLALAFSGALSRKLGDEKQKTNELAEQMASVPKFYRDQFHRALIAWMLALTYNSALLGWFLRRVVFHSIERDPGQAEQVIYHFDKDHDGNHMGTAAAA